MIWLNFVDIQPIMSMSLIRNNVKDCWNFQCDSFKTEESTWNHVPSLSYRMVVWSVCIVLHYKWIHLVPWNFRVIFGTRQQRDQLGCGAISPGQFRKFPCSPFFNEGSLRFDVNWGVWNFCKMFWSWRLLMQASKELWPVLWPLVNSGSVHMWLVIECANWVGNPFWLPW